VLTELAQNFRMRRVRISGTYTVPTLQLWVHCPRASDGLLPPRLSTS
jgi:hypothetical protein